MAAFSRILLSGSTSGRPIKVAATATPGTTIHTAVSGAAGFDEVYLWASNSNTGSLALTIEWGGTTDPDDLLLKAFVLPPLSGPIPIISGLSINGGLVVRAFAGTANLTLIAGHVNRIQ